MNAKKIAAEKALSFVRSGMTVGLGTGSTSEFAIKGLGKMVKEGLSVDAVASSVKSEALAKEEGIEIVSFKARKTIHLYIDGADEVDEHFNLIKGGGGAHLREKILAYAALEFIVIVDHSKLVQHLGRFPLPVEVTAFGANFTKVHLEQLGCTAMLREKSGETVITDNGNIIIDCDFRKILSVEELGRRIKMIPGVVEHGLFPASMVDKLVVGFPDGQVQIHTPPG